MAITKIQSNAFPASIDLSNIDLTLGANEVLTANIADSNITTAKIADGAVHTDKIADNNVTHEKLHTDMDLSGKTVTLPTIGHELTVARSNVGNPAGITIRNTEASSAYSHARLRLESQNGAAYSEIWTDVANSALRLGYNSSSTLNINSSGSVGIGTASPGDKLTIANGHLSLTSTAYGIKLPGSINTDGQINHRNAGATEVVLHSYPLANQTIRLKGSTDLLNYESDKSGVGSVFSMNTSGKIGIGTTSPQQKLHVAGGRLIIDAPNNGYSGLKIHDDNSSDYNVYLDMGRDQGNTNFWIRKGGRQQGVTPWTDATPQNIARFSASETEIYSSNFQVGAQGTIGGITNIPSSGNSGTSGSFRSGYMIYRSFGHYFDNGVSNLGIRIYFQSSSLWTDGELWLTSDYSNGDRTGQVHYAWGRHAHGGNNYSTYISQEYSHGNTRSGFEFHSIGYDSSLGQQYFEIRKLGSEGNPVYVLIKVNGMPSLGVLLMNAYGKRITW